MNNEVVKMAETNPTCPYLDYEYAKANEFDYSCSHPYVVHENGDKGNVLSDDLFELCGNCPLFNDTEVPNNG